MTNLILGESLSTLATFQADSFDSLVTDPPAGISFMGSDWDSNKGGKQQWIAWLSSVMKESLRVLKPGSHALVWALPRTSHWTTTAIEDAGFEIRDVVCHLFGSGFPKSLDVSKAIDKKAGHWRGKAGDVTSTNAAMGGPNFERTPKGEPVTDHAKQWAGWGTALKPASEHWILARKPLSEKTVAANILKWGTGGINIDGCKIGDEIRFNPGSNSPNSFGGFEMCDNQGRMAKGRWPANLILDIDELPAWAKYFYCPKASRSERNQGCEELPAKTRQQDGDPEQWDLSEGKVRARMTTRPQGNFHPCVKPLALMRYLCRLITPPGGIVLDPFMGSGSTGLAALAEGFGFTGIEKEEAYFQIASARLQKSPL